ncbi:hypothetical protein [Leifsonia sp. AG29]|uniref:hypothetical protein n=1 Tax=Leifsonia sp. AG29 TaxID=2598860 RepID=UPI00131DB804|nr:hypothetical protein [Leifsonia sp. AG29]
MSGAGFPFLNIIWLLLVTTLILVFRRRLVTLLLRVAEPREDETAQRRDMTVGVTGVAVFGYLFCAVMAALNLLPEPSRVWASGLGMPVLLIANVAYWVRLSRAGLLVIRWVRR